MIDTERLANVMESFPDYDYHISNNELIINKGEWISPGIGSRKIKIPVKSEKVIDNLVKILKRED